MSTQTERYTTCHRDGIIAAIDSGMATFTETANFKLYRSADGTILSAGYGFASAYERELESDPEVTGENYEIAISVSLRKI